MDLRPFTLERYFARYEFTTRHLLSSSDCETQSLRAVLDLEAGARERFESMGLGYGESVGGHALRDAITLLYQNISPDNVLVHSGAEEAIFLFMNSLLSPGDEVVVHTPCYQALSEIPRSLGCQVRPWVAREDAAWQPDFAELDRLFTKKTRALVVNFPHNPTGFLPTVAEFKKLAAFCEDRGVVLFSDEVYRESEPRTDLKLPAACDLSPSAVSLGVMSKSYGLAGLRIGWVATRNQKVLARMAELKDYTTICNSGPSEFLAEIGLRHRAILLERNLKILSENLSTLDAFFARHADRLSWVRPKSGPIAFARLKNELADDFCRRVVEGCGVMLLPGSVFGDYLHHFRLGYGRKTLAQALDVFEQFALAH